MARSSPTHLCWWTDVEDKRMGERMARCSKTGWLGSAWMRRVRKNHNIYIYIIYIYICISQIGQNYGFFSPQNGATFLCTSAGTVSAAPKLEIRSSDILRQAQRRHGTTVDTDYGKDRLKKNGRFNHPKRWLMFSSSTRNEDYIYNY